MDLLTLILFALALCFDSFAVSISCAMSCCIWQRGRGLRFAAVLAIFQGGMPLIGWSLATGFHHVISQYDHWIAFVLLLLLGSKMIWESRAQGEQQPRKTDPLSLGGSMLMGVATSIDALIAGITMALLTIDILPSKGQLSNMLLAVGIIALITFAASIAGLLIGHRARNKVGQRAELIGGLVLIAIGTKVLIEHLLEA